MGREGPGRAPEDVAVSNLGRPFEVMLREPKPLGDCRECGRPSWHADEVGPVHVCCVRNGPECYACYASVALDAKQRPKRKR